MKIGTKFFPDNCPKCGEVNAWVMKPNYRTIPELGESFSHISFICLKCKHETKKMRIKTRLIFGF